jgi:hypothetical protein
MGKTKGNNSLVEILSGLHHYRDMSVECCFSHYYMASHHTDMLKLLSLLAGKVQATRVDCQRMLEKDLVESEKFEQMRAIDGETGIR